MRNSGGNSVRNNNFLLLFIKKEAFLFWA